MKKIGLILIAVIVFVLIFDLQNESYGTTNMRLRVVASSDSSYDQLIKYEVVDIVKGIILPSDDINDVREKKNMIDKEIQKYLKDKNISFTSNIKKSYFPPKSLNSEVIPGGTFQTLLIVIGKGEGKNWWSLLYPEYFNVSFEDIDAENLEMKFYFYEKLKNLFNNND